MSDEDLIFSRIAPTFLDRTSDNPDERGRYMEADPKAGLPEARWDAYRRIYARNGIKLGILRNASRDAFIMVDSVGILNRGHVTGYLYCSPTGPAKSFRFQPCILGQEKGEHKYDPAARHEGYSFQKLGRACSPQRSRIPRPSAFPAAPVWVSLNTVTILRNGALRQIT
jgi:hypothetical protein